MEVPKFFAPVTNLLLPVDRRTSWQGMRTVAEIKRENNIKVRPVVGQFFFLSCSRILTFCFNFYFSGRSFSSEETKLFLL